MKNHDQASIEDAVYKTLSRTEWKRSLDIIRDINEGRDVEDYVPMAQIYTALDRAELSGWVERRVVDRPLSRLGGKAIKNKTGEYKLTGGLRKAKEGKSWLGRLLPKLA